MTQERPNTPLRGLISGTQRFSIHDGPGIRTLVFMKGCPLRCLWCDNPETQLSKPQLLCNPARCIGCGKCVEVCPNGAVSKAPNGKSRVDRRLCKDCGTCAGACPPGARTMVGKYVSVDELLEEIKKDAAFYNRSGGGVTIGGGEPSLQAGFVAEVLRRSKLELNLNTAVETCGFADHASMKMTLQYADLVFFDIKHIDAMAHRKVTGVSNEVILDNIRRIASEGGKKIIVRMPVVPGHNDSEETIRSIAEFVARLGRGITEIELLPYHNLGAAKYPRLGRRYKLARVEPPDAEHMFRLRQVLLAAGLNAKVGEKA